MKYFISLLIFFLLVFLIYLYIPKEYNNNYFYMGTIINVQIKSSKKNIPKIFNEVDNIIKEYHQLTDRFNEYENVINIYTINNTSNQLEIDQKLYNIIDYSLKWAEKSSGLFYIGLGNVIDVWKDFINKKREFPNLEELTKLPKKEIRLIPPNKIIGGSNIDLGGVAKGYVVDVIANYLKEQKINDFIINAGGQVFVGKRNKDYKIGIKNPDKTGSLLVIKGQNINVATSGGYERFLEYEGIRYHHIIDPRTLFPSDYMQSVSVISKEGKLSDVLSTLLFVMPIDEGLKLVAELDDVEAIWYNNDLEIIKSSGFNKYE